MKSDERLEVLKELLLTDERMLTETLSRKLEAIEKRQRQLSERVTPTIDEKLDRFVEEIPKKLGPTITETLKTEIKKSQDAVAEALYPIMGRMIKKYVQNEISRLNEEVNKRLNQALDWRMWFKSKKQRAHDVAAALYHPHSAKIEQLLVIEKGSGLLKGSYARGKMLDKDMVAGMLTAIKAFVEDAFEKENASLEQISYDLYTIHIQNFSAYYIAAVLSGIYDATTKDKLEDLLFRFAQHVVNEEDLKDEEQLTKRLKAYFEDESI